MPAQACSRERVSPPLYPLLISTSRASLFLCLSIPLSGPLLFLTSPSSLPSSLPSPIFPRARHTQREGNIERQIHTRAHKTRTQIHTDKHIPTHTDTDTDTHAHIGTDTHAQMQPLAQTRAHKCAPSRSHFLSCFNREEGEATASHPSLTVCRHNDQVASSASSYREHGWLLARSRCAAECRI